MPVSHREIPDRLTPIPEREYILALARVWTRFYGHGPLAKQLACCLAQMVLETGRKPDPERQGEYLWGRFAHNFNWGNIKHTGGTLARHRQHYRCAEIIHGEQMWFDPPHPQTRFRAYGTAEAGMMDYIRFLVLDRDQYARAWERGVLQGDPVVFARELGRAGYYTASIARYTKTVVKLFMEFQAKVAEVLSSSDANGIYAVQDEIQRGRVMRLVGATVWDSLREAFGEEPEEMSEDDARLTLTPNL